MTGLNLDATVAFRCRCLRSFHGKEIRQFCRFEANELARFLMSQVIAGLGGAGGIGNNSEIPHVRSFEHRDSQNNKTSIRHGGCSAVSLSAVPVGKEERERERARWMSHLLIQVRSPDEPFTWPAR